MIGGGGKRKKERKREGLHVVITSAAVAGRLSLSLIRDA